MDQLNTCKRVWINTRRSITYLLSKVFLRKRLHVIIEVQNCARINSLNRLVKYANIEYLYL